MTDAAMPVPPIPADLSRRKLLIGASFLATAAVAYAATPRKSDNLLVHQKLEDVVPNTIGIWQKSEAHGVIVAEVTEDAKEEGYDQLLTRVYTSGDRQPIMLLIAYGSAQGGSLQLHRPETCYPAQGFHLVDFQDFDLNFAPSSPVHARKFTAKRDERYERLMYWTRIGTHYPLNTAQEYRAIITSVLKGEVPDGILVRISTLGADIDKDDQSLAQFARSMVTALPAAGQKLLFGHTA